MRNKLRGFYHYSFDCLMSVKIYRGPVLSGILLCCLFIPALGQSDTARSDIIRSLLPRDSAEQAAIQADLDIVSLALEIVPAPGAGSFFNEYAKLFGTTSSLDAYVSPAVTGRIMINEHLRLVFGTSYMGSGFEEIYDAYSFPPGFDQADTIVPAAQIFEKMSLSAFPFLVGVQFSPIRSQFTSYVGAEAGAAMVSASWITNTRTFDEIQFSRPEKNIEGPGFAPAFRVFTGVDLRFDRFFVSRNVFRGVFIEAAYFYLPISRDYFKEVRTVSRKVPLLPAEDDATINLGGFTITLGVNMQLFRL